MTATEKYNGWTNYETWNVKLWMDNDRGSYETGREQAQEAWNEAANPSANARLTGNEPFTREERAAYILSQRIKDEYEEAMQSMLDEAGQSASVWSDLLGAALSEVNWQEIATSMIDDVDKTEVESDEDE